MADVKGNQSSVLDLNCGKRTTKAAKVWFSAFIVVGFLIFVSNLATILTFLMNRHLRRRSVYCLINLAVADMLYGGSLAAYCAYEITSSELLHFLPTFDFGIELVGARTFVLITPGLCLVLVALERFYVTYFPIRHLFTRKVTYIKVCFILWCLAAVLAISHHVTPDPFYSRLSMFYFSLALLFLVVIISSYAAVFIKVKLQNKESQRLQQQTSVSRTQKRERHLAMTMFLVTLLSILTWIPYLAVQIPSYLSLMCVDLNTLLFAIMLQFRNSIINPLVYVFRMRDFRKGLSALVFGCSRYRQVHPFGQFGGRQQIPLGPS